MAYFEWNSQVELEHPLLNAHHKRLFALAEAVAQSHPGRCIGVYAYWNVEQPPRDRKKLPDNVIVALTQDNLQHYDPAYLRSSSVNYPGLAQAQVLTLHDLAPESLRLDARRNLIYWSNEGLRSLASPLARPEPAMRRFFYESMGLAPWTGSLDEAGKPTYSSAAADTGSFRSADDYKLFTRAGLSKELGFVGAHLYPHWFEQAPDHAIYYPFYAKCCELDVPIQMQIGHCLRYTEQRPLRSVGRPITLDTIACHFPELKLVGIHIGWPWSEEMISVSYKHPNVYIGSDAYAPAYWPENFVRFINSWGSKKVIFGTDYPTPDGTCIRDYIHIVDLAQAHILALAPGKAGFFNLGNGSGYSVREVIQTCERVSGLPIKALEQPRRAGDPPRLVAAADKALRELGWQPKFPQLEAIVATAWDWHKRHPQGYRD